MYIKSVQTKSIVAIFFFLSICFCYTESSKLSVQKSGILPEIIPSCVFGVHSVSYLLYTRDAPYGNVVTVNDQRMPLDPDKSVVFLIHGFVSEANNTGYFNLITAWLNKEDINIISLDWSSAACYGACSFTDLFVYGSAVNNVHVVGKDLAKFIVKLVEEYQVNLEKVLVVGHSLGAHVAGFSGKYLQQLLGEKLPRILGLDPAGPSFKGTDCPRRLCVSDAKLVQAYHTSAIEGIHDPIAGENYYFNGGVIQPLCDPLGCSHSRSVEYLQMIVQHSPCFVATPWKFGSDFVLPANKCHSNACVYLGLEAPESVEQVRNGTYYVKTKDAQPFCTVQ